MKDVKTCYVGYFECADDTVLKVRIYHIEICNGKYKTKGRSPMSNHSISILDFVTDMINIIQKVYEDKNKYPYLCDRIAKVEESLTINYMYDVLNKLSNDALVDTLNGLFNLDIIQFRTDWLEEFRIVDVENLKDNSDSCLARFITLIEVSLAGAKAESSKVYRGQ